MFCISGLRENAKLHTLTFLNFIGYVYVIFLIFKTAQIPK